MDELKLTIKSLTEENQSLRYAQANNFVELLQDGARLCDNDFPPLPAGAASFKQIDATDSSVRKLSVATSSGKSFVGVAKDIAGDADAFKTVLRKPRKKPVVGSSSVITSVKSVQTMRNVDIFVSRLHPETVGNELVDCIHAVKGDLPVLNVQCKKLKSRYEALYTSYHVAICVDSALMKDAVELFMSPESWPQGVFIKRYFPQKNAGIEK